MSKKKRTIAVYDRFFGGNYPGVFRIIFAYIDRPQDCFNLGLVNTLLGNVLKGMLERSCVQRMRWERLLFRPTREYVYTIPIPNGKRFQCHLDQRVYDEMGKINKEYNKTIFFVAGGSVTSYYYAHIKKLKVVNKVLRTNPDIVLGFAEYDPVNGMIFHKENLYKNSDCDVFVLGDKKAFFLELLLKRVLGILAPKGFFFLKRHHRVFDLVIAQRFTDDKMRLSNFASRKRKYQFILLSMHETPSDVFSFFDLDCCKVGVIPGKDSELVTCKHFERCMLYATNALDMKKSCITWGNVNRILKYWDRFGISTTVQQNHPLFAAYHDIKNGFLHSNEYDNVTPVQEDALVEERHPCEYYRLEYYFGDNQSSGDRTSRRVKRIQQEGQIAVEWCEEKQKKVDRIEFGRRYFHLTRGELWRWISKHISVVKKVFSFLL
jgi:hypothetical protein